MIDHPARQAAVKKSPTKESTPERVKLEVEIAPTDKVGDLEVNINGCVLILHCDP